jgi:hypothetical protein
MLLAYPMFIMKVEIISLDFVVTFYHLWSNHSFMIGVLQCYLDNM